MSLEVKIKDSEEYPGVKIIEVKGEFDILSSREFSQKVSAAVGEGKVNLIIDLGNLEYINSTGIFHIMTFFTRIKKQGGSFKLAAVNERVREILDIVGIINLVPSYNTVREAALNAGGV